MPYLFFMPRHVPIPWILIDDELFVREPIISDEGDEPGREPIGSDERDELAREPIASDKGDVRIPENPPSSASEPSRNK